MSASFSDLRNASSMRARRGNRSSGGRASSSLSSWRSSLDLCSRVSLSAPSPDCPAAVATTGGYGPSSHPNIHTLGCVLWIVRRPRRRYSLASGPTSGTRRGRTSALRIGSAVSHAAPTRLTIAAGVPQVADDSAGAVEARDVRSSESALATAAWRQAAHEQCRTLQAPTTGWRVWQPADRGRRRWGRPLSRQSR